MHGKCFVAIGVASFILGESAFASTAIYDLKGDFSSSSNPKGVWSYEQGGAAIPMQVSGNSVSDPADTYAGWCQNPNIDGSIAQLRGQWLGANDIADGDIVVHSLSPQYGGRSTFVGVVWTSPSDGDVTVSGRAWDAWDASGSRNSNWTLSIAGQLVAGHTSVMGVYRDDSAAQFDSNLVSGETLASVPVQAGDRIEWLAQATTDFGHGVGVDMTVALTAVPEPSVLCLVVGSMGLLGRRRMHKGVNA